MTDDVIRSRRGVYYDLTASPYEYKTPYGDCLKFSSAKKLEIYTRDVEKEVKRVDDVLGRTRVKERVPEEIIQIIKRAVYKGFYSVVER